MLLVMLKSIVLLVFGSVAVVAARAEGLQASNEAHERIVFGFESGDLQGWEVTAGAFARPVSDRATEHNSGKPYTKGGTWFLSTLESPDGRPNDGQTGTIESPLVRLAAPDVSFRIGGGKSGVAFELVDRKTRKTLASATGENGETMHAKSWHVPDAVGRDVFFRVADNSTGGWGHLTLDDVRFSGTVGAGDFTARLMELTGGRLDAAEKAVRELGEMSLENKAAGRRFPGYPFEKHLATLATFRRDGVTPERLDAFLLQALVRDNPIVNAHEIAYVTRAQYAGDHHNTATIFQCGEINAGSYRTEGALKALDPKTGATRTVVPLEKGRTVRDPEVDYDGSRIVFSMRNGKDDDYHVYTVRADGSALRQLTREKGVSDIDPVWLPGGDIVFSSTRNPKYCMCNRHIMCNLYRMRGDGANIHQIGVSTLFEGHATVLPDGRVLYDRWEYVDRNFGDAQGLWVCNPDGTRHAIYWGNNTTSPGGVINARHLPDGRVIAVLGSCHDRPWGALGIIDRTKGVDGQEPVDVTWPRNYRERIHAGGREDFDSSKSVKLKYADPFPLDDGHFLATRQTGRGEEMALVYLDLFGNEVVVHAEAPGVHSPVVLRPSPRPKAPATQRTFAGPNAPGRFLVQDVYVGTHMQGVKRGTVKALRIVESPEKRSWTSPQGWFGHGEMAPAMNWHSFENKRVLGTVPVEEDGSAYFELPANTFVYFQALDAEGKMVQSMRSGAYVQPGEFYGCVGCHENRVVQAPPPAAPTMASRRAPSKLDGSYNLRGLERGTPPHLYSFRREVQPVFDRSCVKCHDYGKKAGEKLNLSGDLGAYFCTSYVDLWTRGAIKCVGGGPAEIQPAYSWGAHASKLTKKLYGHGGVTLSDDDRDRVLAWMDLNAPYYPQYESAYPGNPGGRMPLTVQERDRLQTLSGTKISCRHSPPQREQLDFTRPECSRLLSAPAFATNAAGRAEALAIIAAGRDRLAKTPRCDMEGFVPCETDCRREERYQRRLEAERNVYKAISEGREVFDE